MLMELRLPLKKYGPHLWTRELASKVLVEVENLLGQAGPGDTVVVDAKGVEVFDYSFANELFGKAIGRLRSDHSGRFLIVEHLTTYTRENLDKALETLGLLMIERQQAKLCLIGKVHPVDEETFKVLTRVKGAVTAAKLGQKLGARLTAVNERLSKLSSAGVVRRERAVSEAGREQYEYCVPV